MCGGGCGWGLSGLRSAAESVGLLTARTAGGVQHDQPTDDPSPRSITAFTPAVLWTGGEVCALFSLFSGWLFRVFAFSLILVHQRRTQVVMPFYMYMQKN